MLKPGLNLVGTRAVLLENRSEKYSPPFCRTKSRCTLIFTHGLLYRGVHDLSLQGAAIIQHIYFPSVNKSHFMNMDIILRMRFG